MPGIGHALIVAGVTLLLGPGAIPAAADPPPTKRVVLIDGHLVEADQVFVALSEAGCANRHYHAVNGIYVVALDGTMIFDPFPFNCGYGLHTALAVGLVFDLAGPAGNDLDFDGVPDGLEPALGLLLDNPDSDGDGILDGDEDFDGDVLTNAEEIVLYGTSPGSTDSDGNGRSDAVDVVLATVADDYTVIPVLVNKHPISTADENYVRDSIENANRILKQARIRLVPTSIKMLTDAEAISFGDDGSFSEILDGRFDQAGDPAQGGAGNSATELNQFFAAATMEVWGPTNPSQKGIKLLFGADQSTNASGQVLGILAGSPTPGVTRHKTPAMIVQKRDASDESDPDKAHELSTELCGSTIAHELGHILTFARHPQEDAQAQEEEKTPRNVMWPSNDEVGGLLGPSRDDHLREDGIESIEITDGQIHVWNRTTLMGPDGLRHRVLDFIGIKGSMRSPGQLRPFQFGSAADPRGDQIGGVLDVFDLASVILSSEVGAPDLEGHFLVGSLFDAPGPMLAAYNLLFDTDANPFTGATFSGIPGIERTLTIVVQGDPSVGPLSLSGFVFDAVFGLSTPLVRLPILEVVEDLRGTNAPGVPAMSSIEFRVAKDLFGFTAMDVPVAAGTADALGMVRDVVAFVFDRDRYTAEPILTLTQEAVVAGEVIPFTISGLTANDAFELSLDAQVVVADTVDGTGSYSGSFVAPQVPLGFYFLTAQDSTGRFAFNAIRLATACSNGADDDGDGFVDADDPGCFGSDGSIENPRCDDRVDNDGDGFCDMPGATCEDGSTPGDPGCAIAWWNIEDPECDDHRDNDGDGFCDTADGSCIDGSVPGDHRCVARSDLSEGCGLGFELVLVLPPIAWLHRRRARRAAIGTPSSRPTGRECGRRADTSP